MTDKREILEIPTATVLPTKDLDNLRKCRDIVRRLAEAGSIGDRALLYELAEDAAKLWAKMQKDACDE